MSRLTGAKGRIVRRFGVNLFGNIKYDRLLERKPHKPGKAPQGRRSSRPSDYGLQLDEKQKLRLMYGLTERRLRNVYRLASRGRGATGEAMIEVLERSLANVAYRAGFATTRGQARQFVTHGHLIVNAEKVDIPSALVSLGDVVALASDVPNGVSVAARTAAESRPTPTWLVREGEAVRVVAMPTISAAPPLAELQRVVEWYAKR
jgi:small subunit ribosomal protein S4